MLHAACPPPLAKYGAECIRMDIMSCMSYSCNTSNTTTHQCITFTNVCPCGTNYNDGTNDTGTKACCGVGCPTHRDLNVE